jgi:hypothetical protein
MTAIEFPVFIRAKDSGEIWKCNSLEEVQYGLEEIDVENEEYEGWDKNGLPIRLDVQTPIWVKLSRSEAHPNPQAIIDAIIAFAESIGVQLEQRPTLDTLGMVLDQIRNAQERLRDQKSSIRRLIKRLK